MTGLEGTSGIIYSTLRVNQSKTQILWAQIITTEMESQISALIMILNISHPLNKSVNHLPGPEALQRTSPVACHLAHHPFLFSPPEK